jgi:hypothetical protein
MTEKSYQSALANVDSLWISRDDIIRNRVGGAVIADLIQDGGTGPDGKSGSAFTASINVTLPNSATTALIVVSDNAEPAAIFTDQTLELAGTIGTEWYVYYLNDSAVPADLEIISGNKYFDLRLLSNNTTDAVREYYINDIVQNSANAICPRF